MKFIIKKEIAFNELNKELLDNYYTENVIFYEERLRIIKAKSFDDAYNKVEKIVNNDIKLIGEYKNKYG